MKPSKPIGIALGMFVLGCFIFIYSGLLSMGDPKDMETAASELPFYFMKLGGVIIMCSAVVSIIFYRTSPVWSGAILLGSLLFGYFITL